MRRYDDGDAMATMRMPMTMLVLLLPRGRPWESVRNAAVVAEARGHVFLRGHFEFLPTRRSEQRRQEEP